MQEIARHKKDEGSDVVLMDRGEGYYERFVTWVQDSEGNNFHGHYMDDPLVARVDFADRANLNGNQ